jgi:hypothetical protein
MKHPLLFLCILAMLLNSCTKENTTTPSGGTGKLTKMVLNDGTNTFTVLYSYDANGKLTGFNEGPPNPASSNGSGVRIVRKAGDLIDKIVIRNGGNADSTIITTNTSADKYTSMEWTEPSGPGTVIKRFTFTYDNQGKIVEATKTDIFAGQPDPQNRYEYTYQNNNLISMKVYRISGGTNLYFYDYAMEYDQKINPLAFQNEWILLSLLPPGSGAQNASANNLTRMTFKQIGSTAPALILTLSYTYNDKDMPVKAAATASTSGNATYTFFYE